ncbi:MAG TPA: glycosyltransferase family 1 protein [Bacteroidales bacterium]|nr:glycosyltransferase family 1 protein [Bacteroidales bacterium]
MKIGFDAKRAFTNNTGLGNYSRTIINALNQSYPELELNLYAPKERNPMHYVPPKNVVAHYPKGAVARKFSSYWRTFSLARRLENDGIDIFHGLSNEIPVRISCSNVKSVVTIHDLIFMRLPHLYKPIDRAIYKRKVQSAVREADRIIAISRQTRDDLIEFFGAEEDKLRIVYQGCNPWFYEKVSSDKAAATAEKYNLPAEYLLYVGTIEERKNLLTIVKALHEARINIPLVAVGRKTAYFEKVIAYIEKHKISQVLFHHHIDNEDLPAVYQQSRAFIYPSRYEGFGIPVLEAINSGVPVITSHGGCLEESAGPGGFFIDPGNTEQLAGHIRRILDDSALREEAVKKGKKHAMKFREKSTVAELMKVYSEMV